ncbi:MAG: aminopeptidase P family protein [Bdellovibrionaceae bacterium]|nr:aminopeptidase P family protein [Pseudobdellovibrionaceae bacterium]
MRKPAEDLRIFVERRRRVSSEISGGALIVASHPEFIRNGSVGFPYRQDSNLYYLTGFEEPEAILILRPGCDPEAALFVRKKDKERETWDGFRFGPEGVEKEFGIKAWPIEEFSSVAPDLLKDVDAIWYRINKNKWSDQLVIPALEEARLKHGRTGYGLPPIHDADTLLGELRVIKSPDEIDKLKKAAEIGARAHLAAMRFTRPGVTERQIQAVLYHHFLMAGAAREGYNFIVAAGNSATTLHYNFNDQLCRDGDLVLIDAGAEYLYYTSDITRTFPINGKFTEPQRRVYDGVLHIQKEIIAFIKPGVTFKELHDKASSMLTDLMLDLGLLSGRKEDIISSGQHRKYYPHGVGHWLGMDVHDAGMYYDRKKREPRPLVPDMVFTVEPGLYIPAEDTSAPRELRGIGVRIEDNVAVSTNGCEVLTALAPKEVDELESIIGKA